MAFFDTTWYCNFGNGTTTGYYAVPVRPQNAAVAAGQLCRQFTVPAVNNERVFICTVAGTTANVTDATWVITRGAVTVDGTVTWRECTGQASMNGDSVNTLSWSAFKSLGTPTIGAIIKRNNGASYQYCTGAGTLGSFEPALSDTAGVVVNESAGGGTANWTSLGPVGNFTGGQAPHARLFSACAGNWFAAGNTVYVGDNHAESAAALIQMVPTGSFVTIGKFICHNHSGSYPPASSDMTTGATVAATSGNGILLLNGTPSGTYYLYGLTFISNSSATSIAPGVCSLVICDRCSFQFSAVTNAALNFSGSAPSTYIFNNTTLKFGGTGQNINLSGIHTFIWQNTAPILVAGSVVPTAYLITNSGNSGTVVLEALDLSQISSSTIAQNTWVSGNVLIKDCKLSATLQAPAFSAVLMTEQLVRSDSAATGYKSARYTYEGTETTETSIVRTGGAADPTGQAQSRKIATTANSQWLRPFKAEPYAIWNSTVGSGVTVTVCGTVNAGALPNNDDIWLEVEYLGSSASPLGSFATTTKSNLLAANAAVASDSSSWVVPSFTTWNPTDLLNLALSNGNLTATATSTFGGVRAVNGYTTGKYYLEYTIGTWASTSFSYVGLSTSNMVLSTQTISTAGAGSVYVTMSSGGVTVNGAGVGVAIGAITTGTIVGFAVDLTNKLFWARLAPSGNWNGSGTANPATGVGGINISAAIISAIFPTIWPTAIGDGGTANFGASAFSGLVPAGGFTSGWPASFLPFKLATTITPQLPGYIHARVRAAKVSATYYVDPQVTLT